MKLCVICNAMEFAPDRVTYTHGWIRILARAGTYDVCPKCAEPFLKLLRRSP